MKKFLLFAFAVASMASCTTITKTARTESIPYTMYNANVADLEVGDRVTYTLRPSDEIQRAGLPNCKKAAIQEALNANGNADLMIEPQFVVETKRRFFGGTKVISVTVSGRPAKYKNFRSLNDKVWTDPVFRGVKNINVNINEGCAPHPCKK